MKTILLFNQGSQFCFSLDFIQPFKSTRPVSMENLPVNNKNGQSYGYTLYETTITRGGLLKSGDNVRDRALVSPQSHSIHTLYSVDVVRCIISYIIILDMLLTLSFIKWPTLHGISKR